jgi:hypothetical protein
MPNRPGGFAGSASSSFAGAKPCTEISQSLFKKAHPGDIHLRQTGFCFRLRIHGRATPAEKSFPRELAHDRFRARLPFTRKREGLYRHQLPSTLVEFYPQAGTGEIATNVEKAVLRITDEAR